jgi:hypothetical protein
MEYRLNNWLDSSDRDIQVSLIIAISAFSVILVRLFGPLEIASDLGTNLEAAHRLVEGLGLTVASDLNFDLNKTPDPEYLTQFPPGSSILMASLLFFEIPLAIALKIIYSLTTIIGWFSWNGIASRLLKKPIRFGSIILPLNLIIAAILPWFYTPAWTIQGTDIFLWAGTPAIVLLLFHSSLRNPQNHLVIAAGLLFGLLISFRFASYFLAFAALLILLQVNFPKFKLFLLKYLIFNTAALLFVVPISIYTNSVKDRAEGQITNLMEGTETAKSFVESLLGITQKFGSTSVMSGVVTIEDVEAIGETFFSPIYKIFWLILIFSLPFLIIKLKKTNLNTIYRDIAVSIACLPVSLVLFLTGLTFSLPWTPVGLERYYIPLNICLVLLFYELASLNNISKVIKAIFSAYIFYFLFYNLLYQPRFRDLLAGSSKSLTEDVLGFPLQKIKYPSNQIFIRDNQALLMIRKLQKRYPDSLFFVQSYRAFMYDRPSRIRRIPDKEFWQQAYVSKNTKIFWIVETDCQTICTIQDKEIPFLASMPDLKTIYLSSDKNTKIMVADLPGGYKFFKQ